MSFNLSTGLKNFLLKGGSLKHAFNDGVVRVYTGTKPESADLASTGTLLATLSRDGTTFVAGTESTAQISLVTVTAGAENDVYTVTVNGTAYTYTQGGSDTDTLVAVGVAAAVDVSPDVIAVPVTDTTEKVVAIRSRYPGESFTIAASSSGGGTCSAAAQTANSRAAGIHFGAASSSSIVKETGYQWKGDVVADGEMGWFRISENSDTPTAESTTAYRIDGEIGEDGSGLEMIVGDATRVTGQSISLTSITLTL